MYLVSCHRNSIIGGDGADIIDTGDGLAGALAGLAGAAAANENFPLVVAA